MRTNCVVGSPPALNEHFCFQQRVEDFAIEQFVTELAVEALDAAIFPRPTWFDDQRLDLDALCAFSLRLRSRLKGARPPNKRNRGLDPKSNLVTPSRLLVNEPINGVRHSGNMRIPPKKIDMPRVSAI